MELFELPGATFFELYEKVGLQILRHTWFNFDLLWAVALLIAAVGVLFAG